MWNDLKMFSWKSMGMKSMSLDPYKSHLSVMELKGSIDVWIVVLEDSKLTKRSLLKEWKVRWISCILDLPQVEITILDGFKVIISRRETKRKLRDVFKIILGSPGK